MCLYVLISSVAVRNPSVFPWGSSSVCPVDPGTHHGKQSEPKHCQSHDWNKVCRECKGIRVSHMSGAGEERPQITRYIRLHAHTRRYFRKLIVCKEVGGWSQGSQPGMTCDVNQNKETSDGKHPMSEVSWLGIENTTTTSSTSVSLVSQQE